MPTYKHPCPHCGMFIERDVVACPACGRADPFSPGRCPTCNATLEAGWVACPKCGTSLVAPPAQPPVAAQGGMPVAAGAPAGGAGDAEPPPVATHVASTCSGCGSPLAAGARFCLECGTAVG